MSASSFTASNLRQRKRASSQLARLDFPPVCSGRKVFTQMPAYTQSNSASTSAQANWAELLRRAVAEPGLINRAYSAFHNYSVGNQLLALVQCEERGLQPG